MNSGYSPNLVEPGTRYFLYETLKNCNKNKKNLYNLLINLSLLIFVVGGISSFLYYRYKNKKYDESRLIEKQREKELAIVTTIKKLNEKHYKEKGYLITDLPKFEDIFEKKQYNIGKHTQIQLPVSINNIETVTQKNLDNNQYLENHENKLKYL